MIGWGIILLRPVIKMTLTMIGIMALYSYATGQDMNSVVGGFINNLVPIKDSLMSAFKTLVPMLIKSASETVGVL